MCLNETHHRPSRTFIFYLLAIILGITSGLLNFGWLHVFATTISDITIKLFKALSLPLISLSLIVTITGYQVRGSMQSLGRKVLLYTASTTIVAALISLICYLIIKPIAPQINAKLNSIPAQISYFEHLNKIIPNNLLEPYLQHNVFGVLLISLIFGMGIRKIDNEEVRNSLTNFFQGLHSIFIIFTKYLIKVIPIALFAFVALLVIDLKKGINISGIAGYIVVVLAANFIQGLVILPLWLKIKGISPLVTVKGAMPALSLAFFSKSSAATLPVTIDCVQSKLGIKKELANFVLPLCTTINMNGCAAFILATTLFVSQAHGVDISFLTMLSLVIIATVAAIGNAGVPMGCFFLSASLLSSMGMDITLLAIILPFYGIIDMVETALNVWSDVCVTKVISKELVTR